MKNCISRRSFLKAAGILGAAGALAACGGLHIGQIVVDEHALAGLNLFRGIFHFFQ